MPPRKKPEPSGAEVEQPLSVGDADEAAPEDASEPVAPEAQYAREFHISELKDAHNKREKSKEWAKDTARYVPLTAEAPSGEVEVRESDVPDPEPDAAPEAPHSVDHDAAGKDADELAAEQGDAADEPPDDDAADDE